MPPDKNEKCNACGGYQFSVNDGFKYCDRCGSLFENFEELEEEEGGMQQTVGQGKVKVKNKDDEKKKNVVVPINLPVNQVMAEAVEKRSDFLKSQAVRREELSIPHDHTPDYLFRVALRIFSFTQVLAKASHILVTELNFEPRISEALLATLQRYLSHCKIAFCHSEQCGNDEQLRFVAIMENLHYEEQEREEKRRKKLARRGKGAKALSKSAAAWTLLTQGNITENLDLASDAEDEDLEDDFLETENVNESIANLDITQDATMDADDDDTIAVNDITLGFVRKVTTALSKEALRRASEFILNLELLVAVIHSGLMCAGYRNVFVSDIVRWIREDRFRISRRTIRLLRQSSSEKRKRGEESVTSLSFGEPFLRLPLYEIVRTCTLFHQSVNLQKNMVNQKFDTLAARLVDNLNLPNDFLSRILLLESIVPCDVSPMLWRQVDVKMGQNLEQLSTMPAKDYYESFLNCFGRKERWDLESDSCDEVLLSVDTKLVAYILLAFRLTFDLDNSPCSSGDLTYQTFDIDTWMHQLEMRIKCWQGHDMSMVLRSSCPIPEMNIDLPFGANYFYSDTRGGPRLERRRRQVGFRNCVPCEMSFNSTATLPTVFDVRHNRFSTERRQTEAVLAPLKFQRVVLRKEMDSAPKLFENVDPESERTFFKEFTTSKTTEASETFDDYFPSASHYAIYKRPDWLQNCVARKTSTAPKTGPFRFYLSNQVCDDLIGVAESSFSRRFKFLLESLSLLIGEHKKAVYAAFLMLEMHFTSPESLHLIRNDLLTSAPILMECQKFRNSTYHEPCKYRVMSDNPADRIEDLGCFIIFPTSQEEEEEIATSHHLMLIDSRNHEIRQTLTAAESEKVQKKIIKLCYNFETFFSILAVKFW